jgi:hypothetical protein
MRRTSVLRRLGALALVAASGLLAYAAVGNGDIAPTNETTVVTITSATGSGSGTATLQNTTPNTTFSVLVGSDATCDPAIGFSVSGGNPSTFAPMSSRNVQITCPPRGSDAMRRCLFHATNSINGAPMADFMGLCLYGAATPLLTPLSTALDFGTVAVGDFTQQTVTIRNDTPDQTVTRVFLQTTDVDGSFQVAAPCNPDATYCDEELPGAVPPGASFTVNVRCRPQATGTHTAELIVGTSSFQRLSSPITLQCVGAATTTPALGINPTTITIPSAVEIDGDSASVVVHLENPGGTTLSVTDVRIVDVDNGAAEDWGYTASGKCSGQITSGCMMGPGDRVAINVTFDPSTIGRRRAALLVSYRDTLDRTFEVPLEATGAGATLRRLGAGLALTFGSVPVGRTAQLPILLANDGNRDATVTLALAPAATPPFTLAPATMTTVAPTSPRMLTLTCAPSAAGMFSTTVTITGMDTVSMTPLTIAADCEGVTAELYSTPSALQLEEIRVGEGAITKTVTLATTNAGSPLTFTGPPQLEADNPAITVGPLSQATTPATFDVTVTPTTPGPISAAILVSTTSGETLRIPITGTAATASYIVAPTLELGTFCVDQPTTSSNVALVSDDSATIELDAPTLQQSPSPFELAFTAPSLYPYPLPGGAGVTVAITPKRQLAATMVSDTLVWHTDVTSQPTQSTALTARFIDSGAAIAPPALAFGDVTVHLFSDNGQRVVIQNCNPTPLLLDPPMIRTPFSIDSPNFPAMLDPNESVAFSVGFHPTRVGSVSETLRITSPQLPGVPLEVVLTGNGGSGGDQMPDAGTGPITRESSSFFACACNSSRPAGGLPLVLALVCALRPRRRARRIG